jgi:hypothetical protein
MIVAVVFVAWRGGIGVAVGGGTVLAVLFSVIQMFLAFLDLAVVVVVVVVVVVMVMVVVVRPW